VNVLPIFSTFTSEYAVPQVQFQQEEKTRAEKQLGKRPVFLSITHKFWSLDQDVA
jgi:hypothetical protein